MSPRKKSDQSSSQTSPGATTETPAQTVVQSAAWRALQQHQIELQPVQMSQQFAVEPDRFDRYSLSAAGIFLDYSKNRITDQTLGLLQGLFSERRLKPSIESLFNAEKVNNTEQRSALHMALRHRGDRSFHVDGEDVMPLVKSVLAQMRAFSDSVRDGKWLGYSGKPITNIINIGIGGSDLGPLMVTEALKKFGHSRLKLQFVSNVDGSHISEALAQVDAETTLFIIASKTFTTQETLSNAHTARDWFLQQGATEADIEKHFVALSTNASAVRQFGIDPNNMFTFWDWVGGRYSLWSAIGLSIALYIGMDRFEDFLSGADAMDEHFRSAPLEANMPVILAGLTIWYSNFMGASSHLIAPYDQYLHRFPAYLQQLTMESNGKCVTRDGSAVDYTTGPIVWGEPGTNGQHAYFQLVHQGTHLIPADFIATLESLNPVGEHHELLLANCFAQTEALMRGKSLEDLTLDMQSAGIAPDEIQRLSGHKTFPGNKPTNTLLVNRLDPHSLGALIALYEHKVYVESVIWDINPFDQWGVELGKALAKTIHSELKNGASARSHDCSTNGLINRASRHRNLQS